MTPPPLSGLTVLEVGVFMAAPFATMQLADLGARVIKIENPVAPDPTRASGPFVAGSHGDRHSSPFARLNRNKESVALDLKSDAGRDAFLRLVDRADALVENLRPGAVSSGTPSTPTSATAASWGRRCDCRRRRSAARGPGRFSATPGRS
jgi:crotonobetainyl-CoA:carnitine CoA-transferase CaiB-like acyl-CoA transferase